LHIADKSDITKTRNIIEKRGIDEGDIIEKKKKKKDCCPEERLQRTEMTVPVPSCSCSWSWQA
jgi:hypothetical protein